MARIILKCPYLKGGKKTAAYLNNLVKYIATRDGVEKMESGHKLWRSTKKQKALIAQILREFPDTKDLFEYADYCENPNRGNATEFITIALEQNLDRISGREKYLDYIANRPRVEKLDRHGLFTAGDEPLILSQIADEVSCHTGNVWTPIISLRREDAARLGYDNALAWKALLSEKAMELAENLKIHPDHLRWYAAFHNESHHPHVHMICYSTDPREGYLTKQGIKKMKSSLAKEIFRQELIPLYREKTQHRDILKEQAAESMRELIPQMENGVLQNDRMEHLLIYLAEKLQTVGGKKQYGYLKADLKNVVDEIVDELAKDSRVAEAYRLWWETKGRIESIYAETPSEPPPLSRCNDFKPIRNMVIQEALLIGSITFEEPASMETALPDSEDDLKIPSYDMAEEELERTASAGNPLACCQLARLILSDEKVQPQEAEKALGHLRKAAEARNPFAAYFLGKLYEKGHHVPQNAAETVRLYTLSAEHGNIFAAYRLGKLYLGGDGVLKDVESAIRWLTFAADRKNPFAQYALSIVYLKGSDVSKDTAKGVEYLKQAADQGNQLAQYRLGKIYLMDEDMPKDIQTALQFLTAAAEHGNQYAQYTLGKLYLMGKDVPKDKDVAVRWLTLSAAQGNLYAKFFLDHIKDFKDPSVLLAATRLLHHMSRIFADNAPPLKPYGQRIDRKLLRKLREKKQAQGHARDDHEQTMSL